MSEVDNKTESLRIQMKAGDGWFLWDGYFPPSIEAGRNFIKNRPELRLVKIITTVLPL